MMTKLPRYYYSAGNADGSISTSRVGADNDKQGIRRVKELLGMAGIKSLTDLEVYRSEGLNRPVRIFPKA